MRFVVAAVRPSNAPVDHAEFDDFHEGIVKRLEGDEFDPFWAMLAPEARETVKPQAVPVTRRSRSELIDLFALLCVT